MTPVDYVIVFLRSFRRLVGIWRGFTSEALSLVTLLAAIGLAWTFADSLEPSLGSWASAAEVRLWTARLIIFVVVLVIGGLVSWLARKLIRHTGLSGLDRTLGAGFGLLRAARARRSRRDRAAVCRARSGGVVARGATAALCRARGSSRQVLCGARHAVFAGAALAPQSAGLGSTGVMASLA